jgi:hypothetical protein
MSGMSSNPVRQHHFVQVNNRPQRCRRGDTLPRSTPRRSGKSLVTASLANLADQLRQEPWVLPSHDLQGVGVDFSEPPTHLGPPPN